MQVETDLAWVAGFLDGDGCITITIQKTPYPYVSITNTDMSGLKDAQAILGGGNIHLCTGHVGKNILPLYAVAWRGWSETQRILKLLRPHLHLKRQQADIILALPHPKLGRGAKKLNADHWASVDRIQTLNSRKGKRLFK